MTAEQLEARMRSAHADAVMAFINMFDFSYRWTRSDSIQFYAFCTFWCVLILGATLGY